MIIIHRDYSKNGSVTNPETTRNYAEQQVEAQGSRAGGAQSRQRTGGPDGEKVVDADFKIKDQ